MFAGMAAQVHEHGLHYVNISLVTREVDNKPDGTARMAHYASQSKKSLHLGASKDARKLRNGVYAG